jgi:hypothetical protein
MGAMVVKQPGGKQIEGSFAERLTGSGTLNEKENVLPAAVKGVVGVPEM